MGKINNVLKRYFRDKKRFADLFNGVYFAGEQRIRAEDLTEVAESYTEPASLKTKQKKSGNMVERIRDMSIWMRIRWKQLLYY